MRRTALLLATAALMVTVSAALSAQSVLRSAQHDYRVVTVAENLMQPWSIAFLPAATRSSRAARTSAHPAAGKLLPNAGRGRAAGLPLAAGRPARGDAASELRVEPADLSQLLEAGRDRAAGAHDVVRGRFENDRLTQVQTLFEAAHTGRNHFSGKIAFDRNGYLFLTVGDRQVAPEGTSSAPGAGPHESPRQDRPAPRRRRVPADNPFVSRAGASRRSGATGHRNVQGLAIHPDTASCGPTSTGRRAATSSIGSRRARTTAGR
jgi:glucose/arabinose dehydrogenase